jgi:hypothetical protein
MASRAFVLPTAEHTMIRRIGFGGSSAGLGAHKFSLLITAVVFSGSTYIAKSRLEFTLHVKLGAKKPTKRKY